MMIRLLYLGYPRSSPALLLRYGKSEPQPRGVLASTRFTPVSPRDATAPCGAAYNWGIAYRPGAQFWDFPEIRFTFSIRWMGRN